MKTKTQPEIWTGAVDRLPADRDGLVRDLFANPTWRIDPASNVAIVEIIGLLDGDGWLRVAIAMHEAAEAGAIALVLRISSLAQVARSGGVAFAAVETLGQTMPTSAHLLDCGGAAFALAQCCRTVNCEEDARVGLGASAIKYGDGDPEADQLAADVEKVLRFLASRRRMGLAGESYGAMVARMVNAKELTTSRAQAVLALLNDVGGNDR